MAPASDVQHSVYMSLENNTPQVSAYCSSLLALLCNPMPPSKWTMNQAPGWGMCQHGCQVLMDQSFARFDEEVWITPANQFAPCLQRPCSVEWTATSLMQISDKQDKYVPDL